MIIYTAALATLICFIMTVLCVFGDPGHGVSFADRIKAIIVGILTTLYFANLFYKAVKWRDEKHHKSAGNTPTSGKEPK